MRQGLDYRGSLVTRAPSRRGEGAGSRRFSATADRGPQAKVCRIEPLRPKILAAPGRRVAVRSVA